MSGTFYELAMSESDEAAEIAIRAAKVLNEIVEVFGPDAIGWIRAELEKQLPIAHATSRWQRPLGWFGIPTPALCNEWIVARRLSGPTRECRECRRALDGER